MSSTEPAWIVVDNDGSWHGLKSSWVVQMTDEQVEQVHEGYGGDLLHYLNEDEPVQREGTIVVWEDAKESVALAMRAEGIAEATIASVLATAEDAIANNVYG